MRDFGWGRSIRVYCHVECSFSQLRRGFRSPDSNIKSLASFDFREYIARIDVLTVRCSAHSKECFAFRQPSFLRTQRFQNANSFGPKTERANVVVGPQLCAGVPDIDEITSRCLPQEAVAGRCERGERTEIDWGNPVFDPSWISRQRGGNNNSLSVERRG